MPADLGALEAAIGHVFRDRELFQRALTHKSRMHERPGETPCTGDNEQLEFLGDAILGFVVSECLVRRFAAAPEGRLSKLKAHLVSSARLFEVAQTLALGDFLFLGRGEEMSGGRSKKTLLVDGLEAIIAAIFLDGGMEVVREFVGKNVLDAPYTEDEEAGTDIQPAITNFKSALQELAQSRKLPQPRYAIVRERGPEHSKVFTVEVRVGKEWNGQADGRTKKIAAQRAARGVYERLMQEATAGSLAVE